MRPFQVAGLDDPYDPLVFRQTLQDGRANVGPLQGTVQFGDEHGMVLQQDGIGRIFLPFPVELGEFPVAVIPQGMSTQKRDS